MASGNEIDTYLQSPIFTETPFTLPRLDKDKEVKIYQCESGKTREEFRNYKNSEHQQRVENFYREQHTYQTLEFSLTKRKQYLTFDKAEMSIWDCMIELDKLVDESDPDTDASQMQHALMTAEAIRKKYPAAEYQWLHVVGLIHDLGKVLSIKWKEPQWAVVGDTFPVGCQFSEKCVFSEYFALNGDWNHPVYSTPNGIYQPHCGIDNLIMSWGHDEYLYQVCVYNGCTLPPEGLAIIRYHSFYPWHREGAYSQFMSMQDIKYLYWVKEFNQFDLYSKGDHTIDDMEACCDYYKKAILKYFPKPLKW